MRIDHHAYQRATSVAISGLLAQIVIALLLLVFGRSTGDVAAVIASLWAFAGLCVWLGLSVVFYQHRLERLESLEMDAGPRVDDQGRIFAPDEARVARRRLRLMHAVLMPILSLLFVGLLVGAGWGGLWWFDRIADPNADWGTFTVGTALGWQLAVAFGIALTSFIFSRFLAGMAVQPAWANLRGGAAVMVGNALVALALGVGSVIELLKDQTEQGTALEAVSYGILVFNFGVAAETLLNFVLNLYRPRRADETPRPAFDSRLLSLLAAPDSIVRSINEAVNYQFGFDITSSWGYQLLLRNFVRLLAIGAAVVLALTALVVVQPQEQAIRLRFGARVGEVYQGAPMAKFPWPVETAEVRDVNLVRELPLGIERALRPGEVVTWGDEDLQPTANLFLVALGARAEEAARLDPKDLLAPDAGAGSAVPSDAAAPAQFALVEADMVLRYRVRDGEFVRFLEFSNDVRSRREALDMRERALKAMALREVTAALSGRTLDEVLSPPADAPLVDALTTRIQRAFDAADCGVEVVGLSIPRLRPPGKEGGKFEELSILRQNGMRRLEDAESTARTNLSVLVGDPARAEEIVAGIARLKTLEADAQKGVASARAEADELRARLEQLVLDSRAQAASGISMARARRWTTLMDAQAIAAEVVGQAPAWSADPELYRTRRTMEVLAESLGQVRVKYMLLPDSGRVRLDLEMQETTTGLNLGDYLEKGEGGDGGGGG